jgi:hypothetical protein
MDENIRPILFTAGTSAGLQGRVGWVAIFSGQDNDGDAVRQQRFYSRLDVRNISWPHRMAVERNLLAAKPS